MSVTKSPKQTKQSNAKGRHPLFIVIGILIFTYIVYSGSISNGFTNWDDDSHVTANDDIKSLSSKSIGHMFQPSQKYMYHPITILSYAVNYNFSKLSPTGYHITNLFFHLLTVMLVFYLMRMLFKRNDTAAIIALLFAVHPLTTEPVNWVTGRKDVLFAFFFIASLLCYLKYLKNKSAGLYISSVLLFILSMLSKPMAASLPVVMLLVDYYYSRKLNVKLILEKLPFIAIAIIIVMIPIKEAHQIAANPDAFGYSFHKQVPLVNRIFLSCYAVLFYLLKIFIPAGLIAYHGFPDAENGLPLIYYLSPVILLAIGFAIYKSGQHRKQILFGALFYLVTISLVIHLIPFGTNIYLAERYAYIPLLGIIFLAGILFNKFVENETTKNTKVHYIFYAVILVLGYITHEQNKVWKNSTALWTHVIEQQPDDFYGYFNRGNEEKTLHNANAAIIDYSEAIRLNPTFMEAYYNRGISKYDSKDYKGAVADYSKAAEINPRYYVAWFNRGNAKAALGDFAGAIEDYNKAISFKEDYREAYSNRGNAKGAMKDFAGSILDYNKVLELNPDEPQAYGNRGISKLNMNDKKGACEDWQKAVELGDHQSAQALQRFCK